jgi:uridylate kinase
MNDKEPIVISLGGSIVVPEMPDPSFIINFRTLVLDVIKDLDKRFFIIVGGGKICRIYQEALSKTIDANTEKLDWIGIYTTHLNAELVRLSFGENAPSEIVTDPSTVSNFNNNVIIGAGWKPGCSTDTDAVLIAEQIKAKKIINLSNVDYVYDSDPKINPNAKKLETVSWKDYRSLISGEWKPGMNSPFDPMASAKAEELGIEVTFISGKNLENLKNYLTGQPFLGTIIK